MKPTSKRAGLKSRAVLTLRGVVAFNSRGHSAGADARIAEVTLEGYLHRHAPPAPFSSAPPRVFRTDVHSPYLTILSLQVRARNNHLALPLFFRRCHSRLFPRWAPHFAGVGE